MLRLLGNQPKKKPCFVASSAQVPIRTLLENSGKSREETQGKTTEAYDCDFSDSVRGKNSATRRCDKIRWPSGEKQVQKSRRVFPRFFSDSFRYPWCFTGAETPQLFLPSLLHLNLGAQIPEPWLSKKRRISAYQCVVILVSIKAMMW